ncbi:MAG TPA: hypothetical protein VG345_16555 [Bryobacteraceae bacterium]|nr:hypothetical protein [Bryobacteraceae bacterium]
MKLFLDGSEVIPIGSPYVDRRGGSPRRRFTLLRGFIVPLGNYERWDKRDRQRALREATRAFAITARKLIRAAAA